MKTHVAILKRQYLKLILSGQKNMECRLTRINCPPFGKISVGDCILLKESGGPVKGQAIARKIWSFENLDPKQIKNIRKRFNHRIQADDAFWTDKENARYATLISLKKIKSFTTPYRIKTPGFKAWLIGKPDLCHSERSEESLTNQ
ncbi:MAG: hypothetical protein IID32_04660 [Planctomycetes bacterium]|nr:hypothetical protein [Planctomycetota bacterium]